MSHSSTNQTPGNKHQRGTGPTVYVTAAHSACTTALNVPALQRFTHSSSTLNESANHPMHWTSQTILYLSSGYRRENNDSLTQVKKAMRLNQYFYYGPPLPEPVARRAISCVRVSSLSSKIVTDMSSWRLPFLAVLFFAIILEPNYDYYPFILLKKGLSLGLGWVTFPFPSLLMAVVVIGNMYR